MPPTTTMPPPRRRRALLAAVALTAAAAGRAPRYRCASAFAPPSIRRAPLSLGRPPVRAPTSSLRSAVEETVDAEAPALLPKRDRAGVYVVEDEAQHRALLEANMDKLVVLKHYAPWCKTCQRLGPRYVGLAKNPKYEDAPILFAEMSAAKNKRFAGSLGVVALPTLQFYANGEIVETFAAGPSKWPTLGTRIDRFVRRSTTEDMAIKPPADDRGWSFADDDAAEGGGGVEEEETAPDEALVAARKLLPILNEISYFEEMSEPDFQRALSKATFGTVEEGGVIVREGDFGSKLFVIVEGEVEVCRRFAGNDEGTTPRSRSDLGYVVASLGPGTYFGERSLITREPIAASVRAVAPTKVFAFSKFAFERTSLLSGKSDREAKAAEKRRLDEMYGLGGEEEEGEGAEETADGPAVGVDGGSIIPLLVRFKLVRSIVQCFDYIASNRVDFCQESCRRRRSGYVRMLGAAAGAGFKDAFDLIDANGNGYVTKAEMRRVVDSVGKGEAGDEFIKAIEGGEDGVYADEKISLEDFMGLMAESEIYSLLTATFRALDEEDTGYVDAKNLDDVLSGVRGLVSEDGKNVLTLGDNELQIDYEQFSKMLLKDA